MKMYALSLIAISVCFSMKATTIRAQTCYFPDGSISYRDTPCRASSYGQASPCCAVMDICLDNALCLAQQGSEVISRGSCTDSTWRSTECAQYCQDGQLPQYHAISEISLLPVPFLIVFFSVFIKSCSNIINAYTSVF